MGKVIKFEDLKKIIIGREKELEFIKYIKKFRNTTIVVKYGGSALETSQNISILVDDVVFMKQQHINIILVHGGSKQLNRLLKENNIKTVITDGIRVTDKTTLKYAIKSFKELNKYIVEQINKKGRGEIKAIGLNGDEIQITTAKFLNKTKYKYVGKIVNVNTDYLKALNKKYIPVLSSLTQTESHQPLNVNADIFAAHIAVALNAEKLVIMTDTNGILDKENKLISTISYSRIVEMINKKIITAGMIPKVEACLFALNNNVPKAHIINGTLPHSLVKEIFTDEGIGTEIVNTVAKTKTLSL